MSEKTGLVVDVDIVSDVMCPWCIVGYRQLEHALALTDMGARVRWHPFELNPDMPPQGQNLGEHIAQKYGSTPEQSAQNRAHLSAIGRSLGIDFQFSEASRIVNTFAAHQLLEAARAENLQHPLKLALFHAHFTEQRDVSDTDVLLDVAAQVGLDRDAMADGLQTGAHVQSVREQQAFWRSHGITGVPSMVFGGTYLTTGAQGAEIYARVLRKLVADAAA